MTQILLIDIRIGNIVGQQLLILWILLYLDVHNISLRIMEIESAHDSFGTKL